MPALLQDVREEWEGSMEVISAVPISLPGFSKLFVVLKNYEDRYYLNRYFKVGEDWTVSQDLRQVATAKECFDTIEADRDYQDCLKHVTES